MQTESTREPTGTVHSTVVEVVGGKITAYRFDNLLVLAVTGTYSHTLTGELERVVKHTTAAVGLDFSGLAGIKPSIVPSIEKIRILLERRGHNLVLLKPPTRLVDILSLQGLADKYAAGEATRPPVERRVHGESDETAVQLTNFQLALRDTQAIERGLENAAHRISFFMPQSLPALPGWRFTACWRPCDRIGGDFYDFIPLGEHTIGIALGDVSGHGLPGAVIMGMAKKVLRLRAQDMPTARPGDVLTQVNSDLLAELGRGTFVTMLYGVLTAEKGDFVFARAGHEPPIFLPAGNALPEPIVTDGLAVGMVPSSVFRRAIENSRIHLESGEGILLISDGIPDAVDERGVRFGKERLRETLANQCAAGAIRTLMARLTDFMGSSARCDDITAVAFGRDDDAPAEPE